MDRWSIGFSGAEARELVALKKDVCGIGAVSPTTTNNANIAGVSVNFRVKKTYVPSSITLTNVSWTTDPFTQMSQKMDFGYMSKLHLLVQFLLEDIIIIVVL